MVLDIGRDAGWILGSALMDGSNNDGCDGGRGKKERRCQSPALFGDLAKESESETCLAVSHLALRRGQCGPMRAFACRLNKATGPLAAKMARLEHGHCHTILFSPAPSLSSCC